MSRDLISRSALLQTLKYTKAITEDENGETRQLIAIDINKMIEYVEKMPTAYDVDKVVEELCANGQKMAEAKMPHNYYKAISVKKAVGIVERGGVK